MIATKEQERKALEQIKKIVADLGDNSYLAAAFTEAFDLAEQNIANDWGCTLTDHAKQLEYEAEEKAQRAADLMQQARKEMRKAEELKKRFSFDAEYWREIRKTLDSAAYTLSDKLGF